MSLFIEAKAMRLQDKSQHVAAANWLNRVRVYNYSFGLEIDNVDLLFARVNFGSDNTDL